MFRISRYFHNCSQSRRFYSTISKNTHLRIDVSQEVKDALENGDPIVALESTIISHGMPYPRNLEVAREVEQVVRSNSAIPATIAVIGGVIKVGLDDTDLLLLSRASSVVKASVRDLAYICTKKLTAATTVASTMRIANLLGISVFATGGIGGVHRGAETSWDVSADISELGKTPVTVVCAGIKSILDIGKSLEMLETQGVPVIGFGTESFPAFFTNESGFQSPLVTDSCADIARMMAANKALNHSTGIVVAVPNPHPASSQKIQYAIQFALANAQDERISGPAITPFLLKRVEKLTDGESLEANVALILNNARVAAQIAVEHSQLVGRCLLPISESPAEEAAAKEEGMGGDSILQPSPPGVDAPAEEKVPPIARAARTVVVVGGAVIDMVGRVSSHLRMGSSNPGTVRTSFGGVARNVAASIAYSPEGPTDEADGEDGRTRVIVKLATAIGGDIGGRGLLSHCQQLGMDTSAVKVLPAGQASTAVYNAIHDGSSGDLCVGVADMAALQAIDVHFVKSLAESVSAAAAVVADANIAADSFATLANICAHYAVPLVFEPTSDHKCLLPFHANAFDKVALLKPNVSELVRMTSHCMQQGWISSGRAQVQNTLSQLVADRIDSGGDRRQLDSLDLTDIRILAHALLQVMLSKASPKTALISGKHVLVSLGARGVLWCGPGDHLLGKSRSSFSQRDQPQGLVHNEASNIASWHIPALPVDMRTGGSVVTNGAGDALLGGVLRDLLLRQGSADAAGDGSGALPDLRSIQSGLQHAHEHLLGIRRQASS